MRLYNELADWYPLLTPVEDYAEEAAHYRAVLQDALGPGRHTVLELGAGAGHNAHHLAADFDLTLTDLSPRMLDLASSSCPGATLAVGDMRTLRLGRTFDAVFIHDALCYLLTEQDLRAAIDTARAHLSPGGVLLLAPDYFAETFEPGSDAGGSDGEGRGLRYLEWIWQREGERGRYVVDYALLTREGAGLPTLHHDRHEEGLFSRATWLRVLAAAGFDAELRPWRHREVARELETLVARARR